MFGRRFFSKRYFGARFFGPAAEVPSITLTGIVNASVLGHPTFVPGPVDIHLTGFSDADHLGGLILQAVVIKGHGGGNKPGGVAAGQKYGSRVLIDQPGLIIALEAVSSVAKNVNTRMGAYRDVGNLPTSIAGQSSQKNSVTIGVNRYNLNTPFAVLAGTSIWPTLHSDGNFAWFLDTGAASRFNADAFNDGLAPTFGASTLQNNKAPVFAVLLEAVNITLGMTGLPATNAFGAARLSINIALTGFANSNAFGAPNLAPGALTLSLSSIIDSDAIGSPILSAGTVDIRLSGFVDADSFGGLTLEPQTVSLTLMGIAETNVFGTMVLALEAQTIILTGFANDNEMGNPTLTVAEPLAINETWYLSLRDRVIREVGYPSGSPYRELEFDDVPIRKVG